MKPKLIGVFANLFILVLAIALPAGCSGGPKTYSKVPKSAQMKPAEFNPHVMSYRNPDVDIGQYRRVMLMPVEIYKGPDATFGGVSEQDQQALANHLQSSVTRELQKKGLLTTQPGPGVARLRLILAGVEKTRPVASTVTHALPVGLALNLGKGVMGKNGSFMGTATVGGEFTDSVKDTLVASFLVKEGPDAMDVPAIFSEMEASRKAVDKIAKQIGDRIEVIQLSRK